MLSFENKNVQYNFDNKLKHLSNDYLPILMDIFIKT